MRVQNRINELNQNFHEGVWIGGGQQGECYRYSQIVYKFLNLEENDTPLEVLRKMNEREQRFLQILASSGYTCEIFSDLCDNEYHSWITTAYMNLGNFNFDCLQGYVGQNLLSLETIYHICIKLIKILNYFHSKRIFHLDVKPENILFHEEYQFYFGNIQGGQFNIENGLIELRGLLQNHIQPMDNNFQFQPDYVEFQNILTDSFQNQGNNFQLIRRRFSRQQIDQLIYWIRQWLIIKNVQIFVPNNIFVKKGIRVCFCDFGHAQQIPQNDNDIPSLNCESKFIKTPYQILGEILNQQAEEWQIARQQDLFRLGHTMCYLLEINGHIKFKLITLGNQNDNIQSLFQLIGQQFDLDLVEPDDRGILFNYYSLINTIQNEWNAQQRIQNNATTQLLFLIKEMLTFSITPSVLLNNNFEQFDRDLPLDIIRGVYQIIRERQQQQQI